MSWSDNTRAVFAGKIRGNAVRGGVARDGVSAAYSVRFNNALCCVQANSAKQLASAQQFWIHRYREAGLLGFDGNLPGFDQLRSLVHVPETIASVMPATNWRSTTFVAYRTGIVRLKSEARNRSDSDRISVGQQRIEQICGTVTLLSPGDRDGRARSGDPVIGRITRLAIDHSSFSSGDTPAGYRTIFLELTSCMHRAALGKGVTHLDAIVHPRHARLYRRVFGAIPIGEAFACQEVGGSPGQYMRADITRPNHFHARLRDRYEKAAASA